MIRRLGRTAVGAPLADGLRRLNARHPWSHNDHFHGWVLANLPARRGSALDVGCGQGELAAALADRFDRVLATDLDPQMREAASRRCSGLDNVTVGEDRLGAVEGPFDLVTMIAVLHHLEVREALQQVRRLLAPGGRLLVVGLAPPRSTVDHLWDAASVVTNPLIGLVKHPWPSTEPPADPPFPVSDPLMPFDELRTLAREVLPGAVLRHRLGFRHTLAWTRPPHDGP